MISILIIWFGAAFCFLLGFLVAALLSASREKGQ